MSTNLLDTTRLARILAGIAGNATSVEIAAAEGISRQRVEQIVKEHGGPIAGMGARVARMLELGLTKEQAGYVENRSVETIEDTFRAATGIALKRERTIREAAERDLLRKLYEQGGFSAYELAKALGVGPGVVASRIVRAGGTMRPKGGATT